MIKLVTFLKRSAALTPDAFKQRWLTVHAPLAARFPGLRGYMLGFSLRNGGAEPSADAVAELWFDSREACQSSYASPIGREGSSDANAYLARRQHLLASERFVSDKGPAGPPAFRLLLAAKRPGETARAHFLDWWSGDFARNAAAAFPSRTIRLSLDDAGVLLDSRTSGSLGLVAGEAVHDALCDVWFASAEEIRAAAATDSLKELRGLAEAHAGGVECLLLEEHVVAALPES